MKKICLCKSFETHSLLFLFLTSSPCEPGQCKICSLHFFSTTFAKARMWLIEFVFRENCSGLKKQQEIGFKILSIMAAALVVLCFCVQFYLSTKKERKKGLSWIRQRNIFSFLLNVLSIYLLLNDSLGEGKWESFFISFVVLLSHFEKPFSPPKNLV